MSISIGSFLFHSSSCSTVHLLLLPVSAGGESAEDVNYSITDDLARLILIYMCCLAVCIPLLWFCPETKGKSLEEIGLIFGDRHVHVVLEGSELSEETIQVSDKQAYPEVGSVYEHVEG